MTNLYFQAEQAKRRATEQTSMMVLKSADATISDGDRIFSLLVSKEAMKDVETNMENYSQLEANYTRILNDGSLIGIVYYNGEVSIINTESGETVENLEGDIYKIFGENGKIDKIYGQLGKRLFEYKNGKIGFYASNDERKGLTTEEKFENFVSKDGRYLITLVSGNNTIVTDLDTGYRVRTLPKGEDLFITRDVGVMNGDNSKIAYD